MPKISEERTPYVDQSVEARRDRREVWAGRMQRSQTPRKSWWVEPKPGSGLCPDCGHAPHDPRQQAGKVCFEADCYCHRVLNVDGTVHGRAVT